MNLAAKDFQILFANQHSTSTQSSRFHFAVAVTDQQENFSIMTLDFEDSMVGNQRNCRQRTNVNAELSWSSLRGGECWRKEGIIMSYKQVCTAAISVHGGQKICMCRFCAGRTWWVDLEERMASRDRRCWSREWRDAVAVVAECHGQLLIDKMR